MSEPTHDQGAIDAINAGIGELHAKRVRDLQTEVSQLRIDAIGSLRLHNALLRKHTDLQARYITVLERVARIHFNETLPEDL